MAPNLKHLKHVLRQKIRFIRWLLLFFFCGIANMFKPGNFRYVFLFCLAHFMHGIGATPLFTIGVSYIDENVCFFFTYLKLVLMLIGFYRLGLLCHLFTSEFFMPLLFLVQRLVFLLQANFYFGTVILWWPVSDYKNCIWNATISSIHICDIHRIIDLDETDPKWVGAWYLGFLLASLLGMLAVFPILIFPKLLPESLKWHRTRLQEETMGAKKRTPECCGMPACSNKTVAVSNFYNIGPSDHEACIGGSKFY